MRLHNIVVGVALVCRATASFAQERLTVDQAVALARKGNLRLLTVEKRAGGSHDTALAVGARLLPAVHLSEEYQHWDCPFAIDFTTFQGGCSPTMPLMMGVMSARSSTRRAIGPGCSHRSNTPPYPTMGPGRGTRTLVGLIPAMPLLCEGPRIEPPQSEPISNEEPAAATMAPAPPDDPAVLRVRS